MLRLIAAADLVQRKGLGVVIPVAQPVHDRGFETADTIEAAAADSLTGNDCEPAFNQVEPPGAGGGEVKLDAGCAASHSFTGGCLLSPSS